MAVDAPPERCWALLEQSLRATITWVWPVEVRRRPMRLLSPVLHPVFSAAHRVVMRRGERGFAARSAR